MRSIKILVDGDSRNRKICVDGKIIPFVEGTIIGLPIRHLTFEQFTRAVTNTKKDQCVVFDETYTFMPPGKSLIQAMNELNQIELHTKKIIKKNFDWVWVINGPIFRPKWHITPLVHIEQRDFDFWLVDGPEGSGKSVFAQQLAKAVDPDFNIDRMCLTVEQFTRQVKKTKTGHCVVFNGDFATIPNNRANLYKKINKLLLSAMEGYQKNQFIIIVLPSFSPI